MSDAEYEDIARRCGVDTAEFCRRMNEMAVEMYRKTQALEVKLHEQWARFDRGLEEWREERERRERWAERLVTYVQRRRAREQARRAATKSGNEDDDAGVRGAK